MPQHLSEPLLCVRATFRAVPQIPTQGLSLPCFCRRSRSSEREVVALPGRRRTRVLSQVCVTPKPRSPPRSFSGRSQGRRNCPRAETRRAVNQAAGSIESVSLFPLESSLQICPWPRRAQPSGLLGEFPALAENRQFSFTENKRSQERRPLGETEYPGNRKEGSSS